MRSSNHPSICSSIRPLIHQSVQSTKQATVNLQGAAQAAGCADSQTAANQSDSEPTAARCLPHPPHWRPPGSSRARGRTASHQGANLDSQSKNLSFTERQQSVVYIYLKTLDQKSSGALTSLLHFNSRSFSTRSSDWLSRFYTSGLTWRKRLLVLVLQTLISSCITWIKTLSSLMDMDMLFHISYCFLFT